MAMNSAGIGLAVAGQHVDPAAELLRPAVHAPTPSRSRRPRVTTRGRAPRSGWPISSSGRQPVIRSTASETKVRRRVRPDRPDEVRRVLDEVAVALLGLASAASSRFELVIAMAAWSARPWSRSSSSGVEGARRRRRDGQRPDDLAAGRAQRRRRHPAQAEPVGDLVVVALVRDARVGGVVVGPDRLAALGRQAVDPAAERELACRAARPGSSASAPPATTTGTR